MEGWTKQKQNLDHFFEFCGFTVLSNPVFEYYVLYFSKCNKLWSQLKFQLSKPKYKIFSNKESIAGCSKVSKHLHMILSNAYIIATSLFLCHIVEIQRNFGAYDFFPDSFQNNNCRHFLFPFLLFLRSVVSRKSSTSSKVHGVYIYCHIYHKAMPGIYAILYGIALWLLDGIALDYIKGWQLTCIAIWVSNETHVPGIRKWEYKNMRKHLKNTNLKINPTNISNEFSPE